MIATTLACAALALALAPTPPPGGRVADRPTGSTAGAVSRDTAAPSTPSPATAQAPSPATAQAPSPATAQNVVPPPVATQNTGPRGAATPPTDAAYRPAPRLPPMTIAGIVVMSTAAAALGLLVTGLVQGSLAEDDYKRGPTRSVRDQADSTGAKANTTAFAGGLSAGLLLTIGAALVVLGQRVDQHDAPKRARVRTRARGLEVRF